MPSLKPAGLRVRLFAFALDYLVILLYLAPLTVLGAVAYRLAPVFADSLFSDPVRGQLAGFALVTAPVTLYFAISESSPRCATWGKRRMGLAVVTLGGSRSSFPRALLRTAVKFVPWELAHLLIWRITFSAHPSDPLFAAGFIGVWVLLFADSGAMFVGAERRTIHDRVAGVRVVRDGCDRRGASGSGQEAAGGGPGGREWHTHLYGDPVRMEERDG